MVIVFLAINRASAAIGILLIVLGIVGLVHPSFTYHQTEEIAKIASLHATRRSSNPGAGGKFFGGQRYFLIRGGRAVPFTDGSIVILNRPLEMTISAEASEQRIPPGRRRGRKNAPAGPIRRA